MAQTNAEKAKADYRSNCMLGKSHDEFDRITSESTVKGRATDVRYNPETHRLELVYEEAR